MEPLVRLKQRPRTDNVVNESTPLLAPTKMMQGSDEELPEFGVPVLCHRSHTGQLKFAEFLRSVGATSVRAGCRQVIEVMAIVIENTFRPDNGR